MKIDTQKMTVKDGGSISLNSFDPAYVGDFTKEKAKKVLKKNVKKLSQLQELFYADNRYSLLLVLQASDAAGKDGAIRHVMSGVNPQGCRVHSFKQPSKIELEHDFFWRHYNALPEKGIIGIFNRSHYENVLVTKVHPQYIMGERIPGIDSVEKVNDEFWASRYEQINAFEKNLHQNGTIIIKIFLNLSKNEQKRRFIDRLQRQEKNWKFSSGDLKERKYWNEYRKVYEDMINKTSTDYAPWHVIPADNKWFSRIAIGRIIIEKLESLNLKFPESENKDALNNALQTLLNEVDE